MDVSKSFNNLLKKIIEEYSQRIIDEKDISAEDLENIWSEFSDTFTLDLVNRKTLRCKYIFKRGTKEGKECGKRIKEGEYCCLHKAKDKSTNVVIYKHEETGNFIHKDTQLVFKSTSKNKIVIGKLSNNSINKLTNDDIKECRKWKFKYNIE